MDRQTYYVSHSRRYHKSTTDSKFDPPFCPALSLLPFVATWAAEHAAKLESSYGIGEQYWERETLPRKIKRPSNPQTINLRTVPTGNSDGRSSSMAVGAAEDSEEA